MIGKRSALAALLATLALVPLCGAGGQGPGPEQASARMIAARGAAAESALAALDDRLASAIDAARAGAARVVSASEPPGDALREAAALLATATDAGDDVRRALGRLDEARLAADPGAAPVGAPFEAGELASIGAQIEGSADAADAFAERRRRAESLTERVGSGLAALDAGHLDEARARLTEARADHEAVAAWEVELATLPVWIETTDELLRALDRLVTAVARDDRAAAERAADDFVALEERAAEADRALRIAMGEGGAAVTAAPLGRLAEVASRVEETRSEVASILQAVGR